MVLWWIGNVVLGLVVVPLVVFFANRVIRPVLEIHAYATDVLDHGVRLTATLDALPKLDRTRQLAASAHPLAGRYVRAVEPLV